MVGMCDTLKTNKI